MGAADRIEDAKFLWKTGRRGSGLLLACVAVAARARKEHPDAPRARDGKAFEQLVEDVLSVGLSVEFRGEQVPIERLLYKWIRCELVHTGAVPVDIEIDDSLGDGLTVRAGGAPDFIVKLSPGWFDFLISVASVDAR